MLDPTTAVGTGLAILGSKPVLNRLLGPTADYVGGEVKDLIQKCNVNLDNIFIKATQKLGEKINEDGTVNPRVLKRIVDEGRFCEDELVAEYFGGVLASARTTNGRDDRGATYAQLTSEMSAYQIRFHYLCYFWFRQIFVKSELRLTFDEDLEQMWILLPYSFLVTAMDFSEKEPAMEILLHCISGLAREDLIGIDAWGNAEHLNSRGVSRRWKKISEAGMTARPTQFGIDYFLWAAGAGSVNRSHFLLADLKLPKLPEIKFQGEPIKLIESQNKAGEQPKSPAS